MSTENASEPDLHEDDLLARRLRALDLRLPARGEHLEDERLAELATGAQVTDVEAAHLAGCDECTGLWVALAADLEALTTDTAKVAPVPPPSGRPWRRPPGPRLAVWALVALAGVAAAALWLEPWRAAPGEPPPPAAPGLPAPTPTAPGLPAPAPAAAPSASLETPVDPQRTPPAASDASRPASTTSSATDAQALIDPEVLAQAPASTPARPGGVIPASKHAHPGVAEVRPPKASTRARPAASGAADPPGLASAPEARPALRLPVDGRPRGYGFLRINARPPARVYIDDKARGWTPLLDVRLSEGPHDVRLVYESPLAARPEERFRVVIEPDGIWRTVRDNRKPGATRLDP